MKKLFILFTSAVLFTACETKNAEIKSTEIVLNGRTLYLYVIDSCEYIGEVYGGRGDFLTHRGNCKFCEQRKNK